jgi:hypothetical protein
LRQSWQADESFWVAADRELESRLALWL